MPVNHVLVSTQIRCECGPTTVGDAYSDEELMRKLEAKKVYRLGNNFPEYISELTPREVLDKLSTLGYRLLGVAGAGQTLVWTMGKESSSTELTY